MAGTIVRCPFATLIAPLSCWTESADVPAGSSGASSNSPLSRLHSLFSEQKYVDPAYTYAGSFGHSPHLPVTVA